MMVKLGQLVERKEKKNCITYDVATTMIKLDRPDDRNWIGQRGEILDSF